LIALYKNTQILLKITINTGSLMNKTGIATSEIFLKHDTGTHHPESIERITSIFTYLDTKEYIKKIKKFEPNEIQKELLFLNHTEKYIDQLISLKGKNGYLDGDTPYSKNSISASLVSANAGIVLSDRIQSGELDNGFAIVRPPGHHAESDHAMGFCFINNIAVTARYLQKIGYKKICILDWDVHHGNGTENSFYKDSSVLFISMHQYPFYPGTGSDKDIGEDEGKGYNINIPMQRGSGNSDYIKQFDKVVLPSIDRFVPDFILLSAGFDAHLDDPLGGMNISTSGYENLSIKLMEKAKDICNGRIISFLEGGYDLHALAESVEVHLSTLSHF
jgi:acetoin utilization deacetylase AcuC-like enzyme